MEKKPRNRGLGQAASRLIKALAEESPKLLTRDELLSSKSLSVATGKADAHPLDEKETAAAAKTLGRLIAKDSVSPIREVLVFDRNSEDIPTHEVGLIGVSINLSDLRKFDLEEKTRPQTQEEILDFITQGTNQWIKEQTYNGFPKIVLAGTYIIHGSPEYDIIIFVRYSDTETYMSYVRDVIQAIHGVQKTHTMQVAHGSPNSPMF